MTEHYTCGFTRDDSATCIARPDHTDSRWASNHGPWETGPALVPVAESDCHGGFDVCCDKPELHQPVDAVTAGVQPEPEERRARWDARYRQYDAHDYRDLSTIGMSMADEEQRELRARLLDYENRITWDTNCGEHARLLDSCRAEYERAERAEADRDRLRAELEQARGTTGQDTMSDAVNALKHTLVTEYCTCGMTPASSSGCPVHGDSAPAREQGPTAGDVVAYRSAGGRILRCLKHAPGDPESSELTPVTSEDLEDGGICTYPDCGVDVLITDGPAA